MLLFWFKAAISDEQPLPIFFLLVPIFKLSALQILNFYSLCEDCIIDEKCGFCYEKDSPETMGSCLPVFTEHPEQYAALTYKSAGDVNTTEAVFRCSKEAVWDLDRSDRTYYWADSFCPTKYSWMAVLGLALFVMGFAPGK